MKLTSASAFKGLVQEKKISYERLARYADCHKSFIEALCNGRKSTCTEELADEIARALGVNTELIFVRQSSAVGRHYDRPRRIKTPSKPPSKPTAKASAKGSAKASV